MTVIATIQAKVGKEKDAERVLRGLLQPTHAEAGCNTYTLHRRHDQPGTFIFVETWTDAAALDHHLQSPHIAAAMARKDELFASVDIARVEPLREGVSPKGSLA